jgi:alpha-L-rhamnosidase
MVWITALRDYWLYSGQTVLIEEFLAQIKQMLKKYISMQEGNGLLSAFEDAKYWNFYEWSEGLDDNGPFNKTVDCQPHSCLNLFLLEAIEATVEMCLAVTDGEAAYFRKQADELHLAIKKYFVNGNSSLLLNQIGDDVPQSFSQLPQAQALCLSILNASESDSLRKKIVDDKSMIPATLSMTLYLYRALLQDSTRYAEIVLEYIRKNWGFMLNKDATSFWETIKGADDFEGAGSLSHGWSAVPAYIYQAYVLGIRPSAPGFKEFILSPMVGNLTWAKGRVPTPFGEIRISWQQRGDIYEMCVDYPKAIEHKVVLSDADKHLWNIKCVPF